MHPVLEEAASTLSVGLPALSRASRFSNEQIEQARRFFRDRVGVSHNLDIVVCGSMARREMSAASDFDFLVVAHGLVQDASRFRTFRVAGEEWCERRGVRPPGSTGLFGRVASAPELIDQIGLEYDTNASLTRRILLLEEGVSVLEPDMHRDFVSVVLGRYLFDEEPGRPPGFLLNDVARYWRTIAVDYQAKIWRDLGHDGWALRFLKLRISRKLTFVSAIVSSFLVEIAGPKDRLEFLVEQFVDLPALARIAQLAGVLDGDEQALAALGRTLQVADEFCEYLQDRDARKAATLVPPPPGVATDPSFVRMREASSELQECLETMFFDSRRLQRLSRRYLSF